jgi:hypothetical protein
MGGCRIVVRRHGPRAFGVDWFEAERHGRQGGKHLIRRFVKGRAVNPDDVIVVVIEFDLHGVFMSFEMVRGEVAVRDCVRVVVPWFGLVDVRRGQRRRERQVRSDDEQGGRTSPRGNHAGIIQGMAQRRQPLGGHQTV